MGIFAHSGDKLEAYLSAAKYRVFNRRGITCKGDYDLVRVTRAAVGGHIFYELNVRAFDGGICHNKSYCRRRARHKPESCSYGYTEKA